MLFWLNTDALAPISRTPEPMVSAALLVLLGTLLVLGTGAPVPCTRLRLMLLPVSVPVEPAVMRTPSWPYSGPLVAGPSGGGLLPLSRQLPLTRKSMHSVRP